MGRIVRAQQLQLGINAREIAANFQLQRAYSKALHLLHQPGQPLGRFIRDNGRVLNTPGLQPAKPLCDRLAADLA